MRIRARVRVSVRVRVRVRARARVRGGLLPRTSHFTFYGRLGQIVIFSYCQP